MLEAAEADVAYASGQFRSGRHRPARLAVRGRGARKSRGDTLDTKATVDTPQTFPNGCHIAEVEIDPDTGVTEIVAYAAVDDAGVVLDHTLVEGQLVGGLAQGIGQALMENAVYDAATGSSSPARSWTTRCRARPTCRRSAMPATMRGDHQSARRERRRRGRHHRLDRGDHERDRECHSRRPRRRHRYAGDAAFDRVSGELCIVLEWIDGWSLVEYMERHRELGRLPDVELAMVIVSRVCRAAAVRVRAAAIVHRDVWPSNIMMTREGTVKLIDFGIATQSGTQDREADGQAGVHGGRKWCWRCARRAAATSPAWGRSSSRRCRGDRRFHAQDRRSDAGAGPRRPSFRRRAS